MLTAQSSGNHLCILLMLQRFCKHLKCHVVRRLLLGNPGKRSKTECLSPRRPREKATRKEWVPQTDSTLASSVLTPGGNHLFPFSKGNQEKLQHQGGPTLQSVAQLWTHASTVWGTPSRTLLLILRGEEFPVAGKAHTAILYQGETCHPGSHAMILGGK